MSPLAPRVAQAQLGRSASDRELPKQQPAVSKQKEEYKHNLFQSFGCQEPPKPQEPIKETQPKEAAAAEPQPQPEDPLVFSTKTSLEDYIISKQIGEGAYAVVRGAVHIPTNRKVAMKIYKKFKHKKTEDRLMNIKSEINTGIVPADTVTGKQKPAEKA